MKEIIEILSRFGIKPTLQRIHILKIILKYRNHLNADEVFKLVQEEHLTISRATIYNTLNLFSKKGLLKEIVTPESVRYDYIEKPHNHFYCEKCKRIYDIEEELPISNINKVDGHLVKKVQYYLVGICKNCLNGGE
ncbi:Fur family transcriptional regulator [Thermosipho atlanticus]|uniref:Fur family transcriptional regulator, peroxide stress response regulator n=1 Tax=Thermosipho atlanticus DSM 15807 TaxID=1123380 RepID=A0A1M5QUV6_9BACT|nr:transcriptional repressor [Thermosipho atlanticus]SHH17711.1 Fur family transcriptional regulator, peroxide stress response regulator [Thermosipho atlanticus DSM 15807]